MNDEKIFAAEGKNTMYTCLYVASVTGMWLKREREEENPINVAKIRKTNLKNCKYHWFLNVTSPEPFKWVVTAA